MAMVLVGSVLVGGCRAKEGQGWHGYYYGNVLGSGPAQVSGPYDSAPQCVASMHAQLRKASTAAGFTCARDCRKVGDGSVENCREVAR